ncbi:MAG: hypothetical protein Q8N04_03090 [Nitrospira sp.]|nr:hypothetical protein [Nitrospira sp.]
MSGLPGQRSTKQVNLARGYRRNVLDDMDGRFKPVREAKARWRQLASDLGGVSELSYQKQSLLWRFVFLEGWIEDQERRMLLGQAVDESKWLSSLGSYTSLLSRIGLERKARQITPLDRLRQQSSGAPSLPPSTQEIAQPGLNGAEGSLPTETIIEVTRAAS